MYVCISCPCPPPSNDLPAVSGSHTWQTTPAVILHIPSITPIHIHTCICVIGFIIVCRGVK